MAGNAKSTRPTARTTGKTRANRAASGTTAAGPSAPGPAASDDIAGTGPGVVDAGPAGGAGNSDSLGAGGDAGPAGVEVAGPGPGGTGAGSAAARTGEAAGTAGPAGGAGRPGAGGARTGRAARTGDAGRTEPGATAARSGAAGAGVVAGGTAAARRGADRTAPTAESAASGTNTDKAGATRTAGHGAGAPKTTPARTGADRATPSRAAQGRSGSQAGPKPGGRAGQRPGGNQSRSRKPPPVVMARPKPWGLIAATLVVVLFAAAVVGYAVVKIHKKSQSGPDGLKADAARIPGIVVKGYPPGLHKTTPIHYAASPPFGGAHDPTWADCTGTVYGSPLRNENAVHTLEHGAVWITYRPGLPAAAVTTLKAKVNGVDYMLMSPYPGLKTAVSVQSWGHQLFLDSATDPRLDRFIADLHLNSSTTPEYGASCSNPTFKASPSAPDSPTATGAYQQP